MISEEFSLGSTWLHSRDPRVRVVAAVLSAVLVAVSQSYVVSGFALLLAAGLITLAGLWGLRLLKRLLLANAFILFLWFFLPFSTPGPALLHVGPLTVSHPGLLLAGLITLKSNAIIMLLIALISTIPLPSLGHTLNRLGVPNKLCHLLLFAVRYVSVIEQEYTRLKRAMKVRGFKPRASVHTYRSYGHLLGMLFVRSWDRAERVHQAMCCRGFAGRFYSLRSFPHTTSDTVFALLMLCSLAALACIEIYNGVLRV